MNNKAEFVKLIAKTGVFFGSVDGEYGDKEKAFVNIFIGFLKAGTDMNTELENELLDITNQQYKLDDILNETKAMLSNLNDEEKKSTLDSLANFADIIIRVDGTIADKEEEAMKSWKKSLGIA